MSAAELVLRVDAGRQMGTGHFMRCLALGQAWRVAGGEVTFAVREAPIEVVKRLESEGLSVTWLGSEADVVGLVAPWVVVDGHHLDRPVRRSLREAGKRVLWIDDRGTAGDLDADLVLNQNLHAASHLYPDVPADDPRLLLGPRYLLLRREFLRHAATERPVPAVAQRVLITLGGADPLDLTGHVLGAVERLAAGAVPGIEVVVAIGAANPHAERWRQAARAWPSGWRLVRAVSDMSELMAWAELAVTSGGTTVWELCFMGVPAIVGATVDVERLLLAGLRDAGLCHSVGDIAERTQAELADITATIALDAGARRSMIDRGRAIVDGRGSERVLAAMGVAA